LPLSTTSLTATRSSTASRDVPGTAVYRCRSRTSLRVIPSPKPAPTGLTLPLTPGLSHSPSSPVSTPLPVTPPPAHAARPARKSSHALPGLPASLERRPSVAPSSVASPRRRFVSRAAALAHLEGRGAMGPPRSARAARTFLNMSDDEDEVASRASRPRRRRAASVASALSGRFTRDFLDLRPSAEEDVPEGDAAVDAELLAAVAGVSPDWRSFIEVDFSAVV
jgi:hypothetical protein